MSLDPLEAWSDDDIDEGEIEDDVDVSDENVKELISQEFPGMFRAWRNKQAVVDWSKVADKVTLTDPSVIDMFMLMGIAIST